MIEKGKYTVLLETFLDSINRGGLINPSNLSVSVCLKSYNVFRCIINGDLKDYFLSSPRQKSVFVQLVKRLLADDEQLCEIAVKTSCESGHNFGDGLTSTFFNCMAKNLVRNLAEKEIQKEKEKRQKRKAEKMKKESLRPEDRKRIKLQSSSKI